jgi:hypothetical protein
MPTSSIVSLALTVILLAPVSIAVAETWHVRVDGGSLEECTGLVDAPYSGAGTNQPCAWAHPFIALPPGGPARIAGGDTLYIGPGSYMMGFGAANSDSCHQSISYNCFMAQIPSGPSPSQPTRILGARHDKGCTKAPELWGTESAWMVVNLEGSSNVELACLEITDRGSCILSHCHNGKCGGEVAACNQSSPPLGRWATTGISARDSSQVILRDVNIHGLANRGIHAGRVSDWTLKRVIIRANGWAGWDGDIGSDSANRGTLLFRQVEIAFNGCAERWPDGEIFGCWAQGGAGYGDGLGTGVTGGHWIFEDSRVHHNTSDGIDLLYLTDGGRVTIERTRVEGNAGNQVKVSRASRISDSVIIGNCGYFADQPNMHDSDNCRGMGDAVYVGLSDGAQTRLINNVITGQGNCLVSSGESNRHSRLLLAGNLMIGSDYWHDSTKKACLFHASSRHGEVDWQANVIDQVRHGHCPAGNNCGARAIRDDGRLDRIEVLNQDQFPLHRSSD